MTRRPVPTGLVIGAGPAGLMAAQELAKAGVQVTVADAMPSFGRKFLMAGKSGLNLTKDEDQPQFVAAYGSLAPALQSALAEFGPAQVADWARDLGQDIFTGSSGRVFPTVMKASPLLRAWLMRLDTYGVVRRTKWRWTGWDGAQLTFDTPDGQQVCAPDVTVLALGGGSWARLGSDGAWIRQFSDVVPFQPANVGFAVAWSDYMTPYFGTPVKGIALYAGDQVSRGECVVTHRGIEGGGIYTVSAALRDGAPLHLDLMPDVSMDALRARVAAKRTKMSRGSFLKNALRLSPVKRALFNEFSDTGDVATRLKRLPVTLVGPLPLDGAISTAGGLRFAALTSDLMLRDQKGVFCAGEMLDWEAPTGGYLLTGCLATGYRAGRAAARYLGNTTQP